MAEWGSFTSYYGTDNKYSIVLEWRRNSADISSNKSNVTFDVYLQSLGSSYTIVSSALKYGTLTLAGVAYNFTFYASLSGNEKKLIYSKTINIAHLPDGTRPNYEISCSAGIQITFGSGYVNSAVVSGVFTLDTVPRTSEFSLSTTTATLGSTAVTVTIHPNSSSFNHKVYFSLGSTSSTLIPSGNTVTYTPPIDWASILPDATSGLAAVVVETYNGSELVGSKFQNLIFEVPSWVVPSFTNITQSIVPSPAPESFGYIEGKSKAKLTINGAAGSYGSWIKSYKITSDIGTWNDSSATTGELNRVGNITFTATVTDSRGRTSESKSVTINVQKYIKPKITELSIYRCNADGSENPEGRYAHISYKASIMSMDKRNTTNYRINCNGTLEGINDTSYELSGSLIYGGSYEVDKTYVFEFMAEDYFSLVTRSVILPKAFATMDFRAGGTGIAIGALATNDDLFEVALPSYFSDDVKMDYGGYIHNAKNGKGYNGFLKICSINVPNAYSDAPIELTIMQRFKLSTEKVYIKFISTDDPNNVKIECFYKTGDIGVCLVQKGTTFDIYVGKSGPYDEVCVTDIQMPKYLIDNECTILWTDVHTTTLPSEHIVATDAPIGYWWCGYTPSVRTDGRLGIGKYLDFHGTNESTAAYDACIYYDTGWDYFEFTKGILPETTGTFDLGANSLRWRTLYSINSINTSDAIYKENIKYIPKYEEDIVSIMEEKEKEEDITLEDLHNFYKNNYQLASFNYIGQNQTEYGFITRDFYEDKVGESLIIKDESGDMFSVNSYISSIAGALQYEINIRDKQIFNQQNEINELKEMVENMAEVIKQLQDISNNK